MIYRTGNSNQDIPITVFNGLMLESNIINVGNYVMFSFLQISLTPLSYRLAWANFGMYLFGCIVNLDWWKIKPSLKSSLGDEPGSLKRTIKAFSFAHEAFNWFASLMAGKNYYLWIDRLRFLTLTALYSFMHYLQRKHAHW